ncbi:MAG TPA: biopolymer transporter ExbD, partial [Burkholderiaceae bacterium]|nr:biopolymer transporter ExbD [Burkholderiaceae bacterium]
VMLGLLVIFMATAPLLTHAVRLDLPKADAVVDVLERERIEFAIDGTGTRYWNGEQVDRAEAARRFAERGARQPLPELRLQADQAVAYRLVAETVADAARAGIVRIGFVSEPERR